MADARPATLERKRLPKASARLADRLREGILDGSYATGAPLPAERDLAERCGISRTSVREALRMLEVEGWILTRAGRSGGSMPQLPGSDALERWIGLFIRSQRIRFGTLLDVREAIEPPLARLAALHRDAADLDHLEAVHSDLAAAQGDMAAWGRRNIRFHSAVVAASHNPLLIAFWQAIGPVRTAASGIDEPHTPPALRSAVLHVHRGILDAIRNGDGEAAARRMHRHITAYRSHIEAQESPDTVVAPGVRQGR